MEGGNSNDYTYVDDPINELDLDGRCGVGNPFKKCGKGHKGRCLLGVNKNGSCRGSRVTNGAGRAGRWAYRRVDLSASVCVLACVAVGFQGGTLYIQRGGGLAIGGGLNAGFASREYKNRACSTANGFYGPAYVTGNGNTVRDSEIGGSFGLGFGVAEMKSYDGKYCTSET